MNLTKLTLTSFLMTLLVACGGGSPGDPSDVGTTEEITDAETEEVIEGITGEVTVGTPSLGRGSDTGFVAGELTLELDQISAGGTSNITASVVDVTKNNQFITAKPYAVVFSSRCAGRDPAQAVFSSENNTVITNSGDVSISYTASGCVGADKITANLYEVVDGEPNTSSPLARAEAEIEVETAEFGSIAFVGNSAEALSFTGIANSVLKSTSLVTFLITDNFGNPIEGIDVTFALSSNAPASTASLSIETGKTNAAGEVSTTINAGTSHEVLAVIATTEVEVPNTDPIQTEPRNTSSLPISVSTGLAVQSNFSLSADNFSVDAYAVDGTTVSITARMHDRYGNPVPEGTIVSFTAESGSIPSFCLVGSDGGCSVDWSSQGARSGNYPTNTAGAKNGEYLPDAPITYASGSDTPNFSVQDHKGLTTITAYAMGEAGFLDINSNGVFDKDSNTGDEEPFEAYSEVFRDDNYNNSYDSGLEEYFEFVQDGSYDSAPNKYQGPLCNSTASNDGHCASNVYVTQSLRIVQSNGQSPYIASFYKKVGASFVALNSADTFNVTTDGKVYLLVRDTNGNIPASGVEISFAAENYKEIDTRTVKAIESPYITEEGFPFNTGLLHSFTIRPDTGAGPTDLEVTIPGGEGKAILQIDL